MCSTNKPSLNAQYTRGWRFSSLVKFSFQLWFLEDNLGVQKLVSWRRDERTFIKLSFWDIKLLNLIIILNNTVRLPDKKIQSITCLLMCNCCLCENYRLPDSDLWFNWKRKLNRYDFLRSIHKIETKRSANNHSPPLQLIFKNKYVCISAKKFEKCSFPSFAKLKYTPGLPTVRLLTCSHGLYFATMK